MDCIKDGDIFFEPYGMSTIVREEVHEDLQISRMQIWFRFARSWELYLGERTLRHMDILVYVLVDPLEMFIELVQTIPTSFCRESLIPNGLPYILWDHC